MKKASLLLCLCLLGFGCKTAVPPLSRIEKSCLERLEKDSALRGSKDAVCRCVTKNLGLDLSQAELELLAENYEGAKSAETKLDEEKNRPLRDFDIEVSERCVANPSWSLGKN